MPFPEVFEQRLKTDVFGGEDHSDHLGVTS